MSVRKIIALSALGALGLALLGAAPVLAGGGCHNGVTQGEGATVEIVDACFTPTTLRVEPGQEVSFVNQDTEVHNVTANSWGYFDRLYAGHGFTVSFDESGIYPYGCTYHQGMTGAIVVGDGTGAGSGEFVSVRPFKVPTTPEPSSGPWLAAGAIGLLVGAAAGIGLTRLRGTARA
jgi:plastocyanin